MEGQGAMALNCFRLDIRKNFFYYENAEALEQIVQRCGCSMPLAVFNAMWNEVLSILV